MPRTIANKGRILGFVGAAALSLMIAGPAMATPSGDATQVTVSAGSFSFVPVTVSDFGGVSLNGAARTTTASMDDIYVTDATGSGAGWTLTAQASEFVEWNTTSHVPVPDGHTLGTGRLSMEAVSASKVDETSSALPTVSSGAHVLDNGSEVTIATASGGQGMGSYQLTSSDEEITLTLTVPAGSYAATYHSDVTITATAGEV